jgi:hypothetical protein
MTSPSATARRLAIPDATGTTGRLLAGLGATARALQASSTINHTICGRTDITLVTDTRRGGPCSRSCSRCRSGWRSRPSCRRRRTGRSLTRKSWRQRKRCCAADHSCRCSTSGRRNEGGPPWLRPLCVLTSVWPPSRSEDRDAPAPTAQAARPGPTPPGCLCCELSDHHRHVHHARCPMSPTGREFVPDFAQMLEVGR